MCPAGESLGRFSIGFGVLNQTSIVVISSGVENFSSLFVVSLLDCE